jgi:GT2 family glycosyltransferase
VNIVSNDPLVSILIVTYTQHRLLARCLDSLAIATRGFETETIVVVNGVRLQPEHRAAEFGGATLLHAPVNLGLPGGLHYARSHARGPYLAIVQDDVEVDEHWLGPLVDTLEANPSVGAVGSRVTRIDGAPFSDGMIVSRGAWVRLLDPESRADATWAVDACFSASCLVRGDAWDSVGGPNPRLYPLHSVDVDLGLRLAEADWSVLVARESVARHVRNASHTNWQRRYLTEHNRRIVARDHPGLLQHRPDRFGTDEDITVWLAHCAEVAARRREAAAPNRIPQPPIPLDVLIHDARVDARRIRIGYPLFRVRSAIGYRWRAVVRLLRHALNLAA